MIVYHDILKRLSKNGWSTYRLVKEREISSGTITRLRNKQSISTETLDTICRLCDCQPGDLISYQKTKKEGEE